MSLSTDKNEIFTSIAANTSVVQNVITINNATNTLSSLNNKNEIMPFLLDVLKVVAGSNKLQELTGELLTKFIDGVEPKMKEALKKQANQYNSNELVPTYSVSIPVKNIDIYGKLKTNPISSAGNMLYDNTVSNFDDKAYQAIKNGGTTNIGGLFMNYDSITDKLAFNASGSANIGTWANNYIDSIQIINKKEFVSNVMDKIYGCITKEQNKTVDDVYQELIVDKLIDQLINDDDSFEISPSDNENLLRQAQDTANGVINYDMGCGLIAASLPLSGLTTLISNISGSTNSFYVGNQINDTINESISNQDVADENKQTIKDNFFQKIIEYIKQAFAKALTTAPQIRAFLSLISAFQNNGVAKINNAKEDLKNFKTFIQCNIKAITKLIYEFVFNIAVKYLIKLLEPVIKKISKERANQVTAILNSLMAAIPIPVTLT